LLVVVRVQLELLDHECIRFGFKRHMIYLV
jgi:hypothetical protein